MSTVADARSSELIEQLYASVGHSGALRESMLGVSRALGAEAAAVQEYDLTLRKGRGMGLLKVSEGFLRRYVEHYSSLNVWMINGRDRVRPGGVLLSHEMYPENRLEDTEWYTDFLRGEELFHSCGVVLGVDHGVSTSATFLRAKRGGRFNPREVRVLRALAPHLRRVFALHRQVLTASIQSEDAKHVLDHLPVGVIIVDSAMRVESANRRGRDILSEASGLRIEGERLVAPAEQDRALRALVAAALGLPPGRPSVLRIDRAFGGAFEVSANPVPGVATFWGTGVARAAVFVHDQQGDQTLSPAALEVLYEMTPAEARLAALLVGGEELKAAAETLKVSLNTVRTQLRSIFAKTGTRRQSELVQRLLSSPARFQKVG